MRRSPQSVLLQWRNRGLCRGRWLATVASTWIQFTSGSSYCFGIYSSLLKSSQGYDQSTLDTVAFFKDVGNDVGIASGFLYSASATWPRGGPWVVHLTGSILCFSGYFLTWLSVTGAISRPPVIVMCVFMFIAAQAQSFFITADVVTAVENFPVHRGIAVGIMKGVLGLSGAVLIQVYDTIFKGNPSSFLLMLAVLPTLVPLLLMGFVRIHRASERHAKKHLNDFSIVLLVVAFYLMILIIWENVQTLGLLLRILTFTILLLMLMSLLSIAIRAQLRDSLMLPQPSCLEGNLLMDDQNPLVGTEQLTDERVEEAEKLYMKQDLIEYHKLPSDDSHESPTNDTGLVLRGEDLNLLKAMSTVDFWLLFLAMACGMGSGLATVNNISQIGESLGYTSTETSTLVSLWSIWSFLGRFGVGYVSDYFLHLRGYGRPLFMAIALATMSVGHVVIAFGLPGALYAGSILVGICFGCLWSLLPIISSDIFGIMHLGAIFNTIAVASPIGSYLLSVRLVGDLYDMEAAASSSGGDTCTGTRCFMLSFLIMACVTLGGLFVTLYLFFRTKGFYKQVIFERLQRSTAQ